MNCPICEQPFAKLAACSPQGMPEREVVEHLVFAPAICEFCGEIFLIDFGETRKLTEEEMDAVKQSPAYQTVLKPAQDLIRSKQS